jgi:hypothetical protein
MTCQGWCGLCYENVRGRASHKGHKRYVSPRVPRLGPRVVFELRPREPVGSGAPRPSAGPCPLLLVRPALAAVLLDPVYATGKPRKTSTLLVFVHEGRLKGCLRDRDTEETAWVSADGLEGILDALEAGLQEGALDWRKEGKRQKR